jgi:hypothetical protein
MANIQEVASFRANEELMVQARTCSKLNCPSSSAVCYKCVTAQVSKF